MSRPKSLEALIVSLNDKLERHYEEVDKRLDNIEKVMIAQEINVKEHMRRSDNLETLVNHLQEKELRPVQRHVFMVEGVFKFLGIIALLVTIVSGLAKLFGAI